jgi:SAM-dependent methyltransferase
MKPTRIIEMASAYYNSCILFTATDLGIFDFLLQAPNSTAEQVAEKCKVSERGARLLLDGCVALELLIKRGDLYSNSTETVAYLVSSSPSFLGNALRYNRDVYPAWGKLTDFVQSGKPVERPELHLGDDPERTRTFVLSMHGRAMGIGQAVVPSLPLDDAKTLLDVGGGPGTYSVLMAQANPELQCTVMDLPAVVEVAGELIALEKMVDRITTLADDYRTADFPKGQDVVAFFGVLHQESPDSIRSLFTKAYEALNPGGRILVLDMMTDETHTEPPFSALFAVNMALTTDNGWVFSDVELEGWLKEAGFSDFTCEALPPPMPHWLASGKKKQ